MVGSTVFYTHIRRLHNIACSGACQLDHAYLPPVLALDCEATSSNAARAAHAQSLNQTMLQTFAAARAQIAKCQLQFPTSRQIASARKQGADMT